MSVDVLEIGLLWLYRGWMTAVYRRFVGIQQSRTFPLKFSFINRLSHMALVCISSFRHYVLPIAVGKSRSVNKKVEHENQQLKCNFYVDTGDNEDGV